jgi:predicted transcriptional regulator
MKLIFDKKQDFIIEFMNYISCLNQLSKGETLIMISFIELIDEKNEIVLNSGIKDRISKKYDLKKNSINVLISNLKKKELITRIDKGIYALNTFIFGSVNWKNIKTQEIKIEWDFSTLTKVIKINRELLK